MRLTVARLLLVFWAGATFFISFHLFTGHVPVDFSKSGPEDPVQRRHQLIRDHKARILSSNRTGWKEYLQYKSEGTRVWPNLGDVDDRILNQIHLVHKDPVGKIIMIMIMRLHLLNFKISWIVCKDSREVSAY